MYFFSDYYFKGILNTSLFCFFSYFKKLRPQQKQQSDREEIGIAGRRKPVVVDAQPETQSSLPVLKPGALFVLLLFVFIQCMPMTGQVHTIVLYMLL